MCKHTNTNTCTCSITLWNGFENILVLALRFISIVSGSEDYPWIPRYFGTPHLTLVCISSKFDEILEKFLTSEFLCTHFNFHIQMEEALTQLRTLGCNGKKKKSIYIFYRIGCYFFSKKSFQLGAVQNRRENPCFISALLLPDKKKHFPYFLWGTSPTRSKWNGAEEPIFSEYHFTVLSFLAFKSFVFVEKEKKSTKN